MNQEQLRKELDKFYEEIKDLPKYGQDERISRATVLAKIKLLLPRLAALDDGIKYFIEDKNTQEWYCLGEGLNTLPHDPGAEWTNDPNRAIQFNTREEAQDFFDKHLRFDWCHITEHKFVDDGQEGKGLQTKVISAFPGTGKSWFVKNSRLKCLDSDSSKFDKKDFPWNYIEHIKDNIGKWDYIFVSSHDVVRDALLQSDIKFTCVYPDMSCKKEYMQRFKDRDNNEKFINLISDNWKSWIKDLDIACQFPTIRLTKGTFLSDVLQIYPTFQIPVVEKVRDEQTAKEFLMGHLKNVVYRCDGHIAGDINANDIVKAMIEFASLTALPVADGDPYNDRVERNE